MEDYVDEHLMVMNKHSFKIKYVHAIDLGYWGNFPPKEIPLSVLGSHGIG